MKINELIHGFEIFKSNEEKEVLEKIQGTKPIEVYTEREQVVIENLIRKSLVRKIARNNEVLISRNE